MPQYVPLPDGSYVTVQEGETPAAAWLRAQKQYPEAFEALKPKAQPESGFLPALRAGATELGGGISALMGKVGIRDMEKAQAEYDAAKKRASEIFKPTEAGWTEAPLTKFGELLGGSLPYMAAPLAAGAAAAALPVTGTAAAVLGLGAAGLTSAGQFTATNLARQMEGEEGTMPKKRLAETELGSAALASVPMALLDTLSMRMIPGIGRIFGQAGIKITAETAKEIAEQGLKKTLADYGTKTFKTAGIEGVTEATQQVFERLQAGLSITDPKAREEYFDSFLGGAVLGGTLAPAGRFIERGREQREARGLLDAQAQKERADAAKAEEEKKKDPAYALQLDADYQAAVKRMQELQAAVPKKPAKDALPEERAAYKEAVDARNTHLKDVLQPLTEEYRPRKAEIAQLKEQQRVAGLTPIEYQMEQMGIKPPADTGPATLEEAALLREEAPPVVTPEMAYAYEQLDYAKSQGQLQVLNEDEQRELNVGVLIQDPGMAQQLLKSRPSLPGMNRKESDTIYSLLKLQLDKLSGDIAAGRELEAATRAQSDTEQQAAREQAAKSAALQQQLAFEGEAERTAMQELAASRAADMRVRGLQATRTAPQLGLFPEERETVTQTEKQGAPGKTLIARQIESVTKQLGDVQRQLDEAQAAPTSIGGPWTDLQGAERTEYGLRFVEDLNKRKQQLENVLGGLRKQQEAATVPAGARVERAPATLLAPAQPDTRPQGALAERLNVLAERVLAAPNADEETKNLVRQVQDNLPRLLQQETRPERVLGKRGEMAVQQAEAASVGAWLYRTLQGTAPADLTQDIRNRLAELEAGKRSETEQVTQYAGRALTPQEQQAVVGTALEGRQGVMTREPTGEVRRAVQTEIEMPEPTAKAFQSFGAFNDYLASEGLQAYRLQKGLVFPTLANLQKKLAPIQTRVQALQKQLDEVNTRRAALQKADVAERGAASELLREAQQKLKTVIQSLDDTARTTYVGQQLKKVDLVDLLDEAHGRLNAGLAHSANLREQFAQALKSVASAEDATTPIMVDANGNATKKKKKAVRTVARGQLPGYQALRKAQLDLQAKGIALVQADQKLEQVIKAGIGQSWDAGSPTLNAYLRAKKAKDEAQRAAQQAHYVLVQAYKRIPSTEALNNNLVKFLNEKGSIDTEMAKAAKSLSDIRLGVRNASNRLNDAYTRAENNPDLRFGESLLRLRNDLLAAESISNEAMGRSVVRQAQSERLLQESRDIAQPMRAMKQQVSTALREAQQRAAERQVEPVETRADREAQDAEQRREEQARLERADTGPRTLVEFKRMETADEKLRKFAERLQAATTAGERATIRKELDEYLKERIVKKEADLDEMKRKAAKNIQDMNAQRKVVAELTERLKGDLTPKRRESAEKQLAEAQRKVAEHQRRYLLNTKEMKVTRTDIQTQRQDRNRLLAEASGRRVEGERLGVAEGTQPRATGPVTTPEVTPPKALRTGSEESRAGATTTDTQQRLTEARGVQQRDVPMTAAEAAEANRAAAEMQTVEGVTKAEAALDAEFKAAKERGFRPGEQDRFRERQEILSKRKDELRQLKAVVAVGEAEPTEATPAKVKPLKEAAEKRKTKPTRSEVVEDIEEDLYEEPEIELLGGPEEDVFHSRGTTETPSTTASVRTELRKAFPDLGRVQIYDSVEALVAANPQYEGRIPDDARGFVDTAGNKAFLIAENINQGQALSVLLHEVGAHIGLKNMLGEAQYNALVKAVQAWEKRNDASRESRVARAARARVEAAETPASQVNDELLAYAVEEAVNAGVKPMETKGVLGQWLSQIATLFRKALEKFGLPPKSLDAQGLVDMAFGAAKMEMQPAVAATSKTSTRIASVAERLSKNITALDTNKPTKTGAEAVLRTIKRAEKAGSLPEGYSDFAEWVLERSPHLANMLSADMDPFVSWGQYSPLFNVLSLANGNDDSTTVVHEMLHHAERMLPIDMQKQVIQEWASRFTEAYKSAKPKQQQALKDVIEAAVLGTANAQQKAIRHFNDGTLPKAQYYQFINPSEFWAVNATNAFDKLYVNENLPLLRRTLLWLLRMVQQLLKAGDFSTKPNVLRGLNAVLDGKGEFVSNTMLAELTDADIKKQLSILHGDIKSAALIKPTQTKAEEKVLPEVGEVLFSRNLPTAARVADSLIAKEKGVFTKLKENFLGLGGRTQFVDKLAPSEEALKRGGVDPTKALQAMYYLRMYDMRMHFTSQSITEGVPELVEKTRRDGKTERIIETKPGANIQQVVDILKAKDVVKAAGSADGANKLFTLYLAAIRGDRVGYDTLNFGRVWAEAEVKRIESQLKSTTLSQEQRSVLQKRRKDLADKIPTMPTEADIKAARAEIEADPTLKKAFDEARDIYNQYNRNLLEFSVQTGAISRAEANKYLSNNDYIPYYRMRDGVAEMVIGNETPIRIGNLKDSPHLKELVGGDEAIFDFLTSSVQNTSMLLDMATKNLATKNLMFELRDVGLATINKVPKNGKVPEGAVTFKRDGEDHFAIVDTDTIGINSDLLVKGLAGIPTMFPAFIRVLGIPSRILRRAVVASPVYMGRQLFRDSLGAALTSGADIVPVLSALKQIGKPSVLQSRGITGGQVFTGMPEDVTRMLKNMQAGKISVTNGLAWLEAKSAQVDGLTREAQYDSYLKQGMSEMEATLMALESMNFSKRGLSPTMHMASTLIPFFNSQIQGLDVLYKAFTGQMPLNERLAVREKLWTRGLMLAGLSIAYAMAMQDDETYKNAKPEEKYGNWFVKVPGFDQMVRLPVPFELGYIFKSLPEAMVNIVMNDKGGEEAGKALTHIVRQMVPGLSSYFMPQAVKPALEVALGKSMYTGRDIESTREKMVEPGYRYRDNTTSLAREVGELTGFSPIKMEYLINGYFGTLGMALLGALSAPFGKEGPEAATKRASDMPVVGTLFQPNDASGIIDATYERMNEIKQIKQTYEDLIEKGRQADAAQYLKQNMDDMSLAAVAGSFTQAMKQIAAYERAVKASSMSPDAKREQLDKARQIKIQIASSVRAMADKKAPQAALP